VAGFAFSKDTILDPINYSAINFRQLLEYQQKNLPAMEGFFVNGISAR
jgi:hypothetical protein